MLQKYTVSVNFCHVSIAFRRICDKISFVNIAVLSGDFIYEEITFKIIKDVLCYET